MTLLNDIEITIKSVQLERKGLDVDFFHSGNGSMSEMFAAFYHLDISLAQFYSFLHSLTAEPTALYHAARSITNWTTTIILIAQLIMLAWQKHTCAEGQFAHSEVGPELRDIILFAALCDTNKTFRSFYKSLFLLFPLLSKQYSCSMGKNTKTDDTANFPPKGELRTSCFPFHSLNNWKKTRTRFLCSFNHALGC